MQMVPTMFVRLLALPDAVRKGHDLSSLQKIVHAAAPCPVEIKHRMIEWLGPIIYEYYGGFAGNGSTFLTPPEGLERPGLVGGADWGTLSSCDAGGGGGPAGVEGLGYFEGGGEFKYYKPPQKKRPEERRRE